MARRNERLSSAFLAAFIICLVSLIGVRGTRKRLVGVGFGLDDLDSALSQHSLNVSRDRNQLVGWMTAGGAFNEAITGDVKMTRTALTDDDVGFAHFETLLNRFRFFAAY